MTRPFPSTVVLLTDSHQKVLLERHGSHLRSVSVYLVRVLKGTPPLTTFLCLFVGPSAYFPRIKDIHYNTKAPRRAPKVRLLVNHRSRVLRDTRS